MDSDIPVVDFDEVEREYRSRGVELRDLAGADGHFDRWADANGLPGTGEEGRDRGSSRTMFRRYREAADGEAACPPRIDFWHFLLDFADGVPWIEGRGERRKEVTVHPAMVPVPADPTAEELAAGRARIEAANGPIPDEAWAGVAGEEMQRRVRAARAKEIIAEIAGRHGVDLGEHGRAVRIMMKVDC